MSIRVCIYKIHQIHFGIKKNSTTIRSVYCVYRSLSVNWQNVATSCYGRTLDDVKYIICCLSLCVVYGWACDRGRIFQIVKCSTQTQNVCDLTGIWANIQIYLKKKRKKNPTDKETKWRKINLKPSTQRSLSVKTEDRKIKRFTNKYKKNEREDDTNEIYTTSNLPIP